MSETPEVTNEDIVAFQAQAAEHLRTQPERDTERERKRALHPLDRLIEQAHEGGDVTISAESLLSLVESEASLRQRQEETEAQLVLTTNVAEALQADADLLRTQLQQAEQDLSMVRAGYAQLERLTDDAQAQLQQAETALRQVMELPLDDDTLWWNRDTPVAPKAIIIARQYFAAPRGTPPNPPTPSFAENVLDAMQLPEGR